MPLTTTTLDETDGARWRFFSLHAGDYWRGRKLIDWLAFDGVMKYGSREAAIDAAMSEYAGGARVDVNGLTLTTTAKMRAMHGIFDIEASE